AGVLEYRASSSLARTSTESCRRSLQIAVGVCRRFWARTVLADPAEPQYRPHRSRLSASFGSFHSANCRCPGLLDRSFRSLDDGLTPRSALSPPALWSVASAAHFPQSGLRASDIPLAVCRSALGLVPLVLDSTKTGAYTKFKTPSVGASISR